MKKLLIGIMLAVFLSVSLTGCGKRSESQIKSDFIDQDAYITPYNMTVDSFEITERQTTKNSDIVTVSVTVSDSQYSMTRECVMDYEKYNDGWKLDQVVTNYVDYLADNTNVSQADADQLVAGQVSGDVTFTKREDSNNHVRFYYTKQTESYYRVREYTICVDYMFEPETRWTGTVTEDLTRSTVDLVGEWSYQDADRSYWVKIIDFDTANARVTYEYKFHGEDINSNYWGRIINDAESSGEVVGSYYSYGFENWSEGTASWHMDTPESNLRQIGFFVGEEAKMKNGMGAGVYFNNYWLARQ